MHFRQLLLLYKISLLFSFNIAFKVFPYTLVYRIEQLFTRIFQKIYCIVFKSRNLSKNRIASNKVIYVVKLFKVDILPLSYDKLLKTLGCFIG